MTDDPSARATASGGAEGRDGSTDLHALISRRAVSRRFSCAPEHRWRRLVIGLVGFSAGTAALALLQHLLPMTGALGASVLIGLAAVIAARCRLQSRAQILRWDGVQWWWQQDAPLGATADTDVAATHDGDALVDAPVGAHAQPAAGSRLANQAIVPVVPIVLVDVEHWMLLRLTPVEASWRFWRHRHLAVSRRSAGAAWPLLRIHLFMA
ncbi:hypothetical protein [Roseateles amylovorans]|uniref:Uncharacterized protein n=1 Tax=Roseateles amylovorans TaxID=2978473 RepID=A0ABY6AZ89_9BURK|nr:hypothetical protein [Roseateles amylovorans]UXH77608.1 hypothetical protein N4261_21890 [Roseateles amylovorans]